MSVEEMRVYEYKGNRYLVLQSKNIKMKDPKTGIWIDCVCYVKDPGNQAASKEETYIRAISDFEHSFALVPTEEKD